MPTAKPRIAITLSEPTYNVIARMAELQGRSRGSVVAELMESVSPALGRTVALLEAAADAPKQVREGLKGVVEQVHGELVAVAGDSIAQMDWLLSDLQGGAEAGPTPVPVTRGSGIDSTPSISKKKSKR